MVAIILTCGDVTLVSKVSIHNRQMLITKSDYYANMVTGNSGNLCQPCTSIKLYPACLSLSLGGH